MTQIPRTHATMANTPDRRVYVLPGDTTAPALARRHVRRDLTAWGVPDDRISDAVLVISEIATNAVAHTDSPRIQVEIEKHPGEIRVAVRDSGSHPGTPFLQPPPAPRDEDPREGGRGLDIVRQLAARCGADSGPGQGLRVWAAIGTGAPLDPDRPVNRSAR